MGASIAAVKHQLERVVAMHRGDLAQHGRAWVIGLEHHGNAAHHPSPVEGEPNEVPYLGGGALYC